MQFLFFKYSHCLKLLLLPLYHLCSCTFAHFVRFQCSSIKSRYPCVSLIIPNLSAQLTYCSLISVVASFRQCELMLNYGYHLLDLNWNLHLIVSLKRSSPVTLNGASKVQPLLIVNYPKAAFGFSIIVVKIDVPKGK